jgi:GTP cyclohydrolase I
VVSWLEKGLVATPHAQRSLAKVSLSWTVNELNHWMSPFKTFQMGLESLISASETALGTPSQSLVKRADEKKFAKINAANTMFCEDAARRLYECYSKLAVPQFFGEVRHFESLHPFDVMARFGKK